MPWYAVPGKNLNELKRNALTWHDNACASEMIPRPGQDETGADDLADCWTDLYAEGYYLLDGRGVIFLPDDSPYTTGLTPTTVNTGTGHGDLGDLAGATPAAELVKQIPRFWKGQPVPRAPDNSG